MAQIMTMEFAEAMNEVVRELAEEIAWRYEGGDMMAASPAIEKIAKTVAVLKEARYEPSEAAVNLLAQYKRQQN
ncbi:hypothetical protein [Rhizobium sp. BK176]|uniref:hypothetical protein n=1 Tax=Rhizobium sp. BK176 TaxID=2587071 RepID=UPI0021684DEE|nr:hypothetical protein [Rhizobium sp. BK176]MCS4089350.1 hypothetical protein [Rhizobium sp. BK176]